jgi:hypothetical protein
MIQTVPVKFKTFPECAENHDERFFFYKLQALIIYGLFFYPRGLIELISWDLSLET